MVVISSHGHGRYGCGHGQVIVVVVVVVGSHGHGRYGCGHGRGRGW